MKLEFEKNVGISMVKRKVNTEVKQYCSDVFIESDFIGNQFSNQAFDFQQGQVTPKSSIFCVLAYKSFNCICINHK